jgi:endonuclease I
MNIRILTFVVLLLAFAKANSQVVINELDTDTPGTDDQEFVELLSTTPFFSLNGYVLVFFNGNPNSSTTGMGRSYYAVDLDGLQTDNNGLIVLGSSLVSPVPDRLLAESIIQNGADAIGLYLGNDTDFPDRTLATTTNLVSALVYDTNDADDFALLNLLGEQVQYNEGENGPTTANSIQRKADGTYEAKVPTPHSLNDATSPTYIGISYTVSASEINEGDVLHVTFTLSRPYTSDFTLNFTLNNGTFTTADYTGPTQVTFITGQTSVLAVFNTIDDSLNEGNEMLKIDIENQLPSGFKRLKDNETVTVIDNDFIVAAYGSPLAPTYGVVTSTEPASYYDSLDGLTTDQLKQAITNIIAQEFTVRIHTYKDLITILEQADVSPLNSNNVWLLYTEQQRRIIDYQTSSSSVGKWNREHIYPQSRGGFGSIEYDSIADGMSVWTETNRDSLRHGFSDAHHLRAADGPENSARGNQNYPEYNGPAGSAGSWHGDVARAILYMTLRYTGLNVVNGAPPNASGVRQIGDLATLLQWHRDDPPDDFEMNRNNVVYTWQVNRNPFIDRPSLVEYIWGANAGQAYPLSTASTALTDIKVYPNPSQNGIFILDGIKEPTNYTVTDLLGRNIINEQRLLGGDAITIKGAPGTYILQLKTDAGVRNFKLIVE